MQKVKIQMAGAFLASRKILHIWLVATGILCNALIVLALIVWYFGPINLRAAKEQAVSSLHKVNIRASNTVEVLWHYDSGNFNFSGDYASSTCLSNVDFAINGPNNWAPYDQISWFWPKVEADFASLASDPTSNGTIQTCISDNHEDLQVNLIYLAGSNDRIWSYEVALYDPTLRRLLHVGSKH